VAIGLSAVDRERRWRAARRDIPFRVSKTSIEVCAIQRVPTAVWNALDVRNIGMHRHARK